MNWSIYQISHSRIVLWPAWKCNVSKWPSQHLVKFVKLGWNWWKFTFPWEAKQTPNFHKDKFCGVRGWKGNMAWGKKVYRKEFSRVCKSLKQFCYRQRYKSSLYGGSSVPPDKRGSALKGLIIRIKLKRMLKHWNKTKASNKKKYKYPEELVEEKEEVVYYFTENKIFKKCCWGVVKFRTLLPDLGTFIYANTWWGTIHLVRVSLL